MSQTYLHLEDLHSDPVQQFAKWFSEAAVVVDIRYPNACCLSTISTDGFPDSRMVLLKDFGEDGFVFYTNANSQKGQALAKNKKAALCFYWDSLKRQVRIQGTVTVAADEISDSYFKLRPRDSQLGAWASNQSEELESRQILDQRFREFSAKFANQDVPRPAHWRGFLVQATQIEFWQEGESRLHDRFLYRRTGNKSWKMTRLYP